MTDLHYRMPPDVLQVFAPAKVNLHLHVTGRRDDGYHNLDSLVTFADIGDLLVIVPAKTFSFAIEGVFAESFTRTQLESSPQSKNLVVRAAWMLADFLARELDVSICLKKNLPLGGGIGGGSADAAACLWGLCQHWGITLPPAHMLHMAQQLGSDVPVCVKSQPCIMKGTGDILREAPEMPELPVLLVWPGEPVATADVFRSLDMPAFSHPVDWPAGLDSPASLCDWLAVSTRNDLTEAANEFLPSIDYLLRLLRQQPGCLLSRMSGSGSTCWGIFTDEEKLELAAEAISLAHPAWWVRAGWLNRVSRY